MPLYKRYARFERELTPKSIQDITSSVNRLCAYAETDKINQLNTETIKAFLYHNRETLGWSAKTFRNVRQYLSSFFRFCKENGYCKSNPVDPIGKPKLAKRIPRFLSKEDTLKILSVIPYCNWGSELECLRNEAIIYTLLYTGIRNSELRHLKIADVNLEEDTITVFKGKGSKDRVVPIHPKLKGVLVRYSKQWFTSKQSTVWFFNGIVSTNKLGSKALLKICSVVSKRAIVKFTPHMLRHTFGRLSIEADFNIYKLKEIMGHSSIETTLVYVSASMENIKKSFNSVELL